MCGMFCTMPGGSWTRPVEDSNLAAHPRSAAPRQTANVEILHLIFASFFGSTH
nr:MAG TPA: hypothetical protein [Caudoviricetes sp.]